MKQMTITELKTENEELKAENRDLREQLERMTTIFESLSEGVVATSTAGEFWLANPTAVGIAGKGPTENSPAEWSEHYGTFYPDKITPVSTDELPLMKAMQGIVTDNVELFLRNEARPDGVSISVSGRPLLGASGEPIGGVILLRDITELKTVQSKLDETMSSYQNQTQVLDAIFNSIGDGLVVVNDYGEYVMFNPRAVEMGGDKLVGKHIKDAPRLLGLFEPNGEKPFPADELPLTRALLGENTDNVEMLLQSESLSSGMHVSVSGRPILSKEGYVSGAVAVVRDFTKLKQTEDRLKETIAQLQQQTQLLESVFNSMSDGVVVADEHNIFTMINPTAERFIGGMPTDLPSKKWSAEYGMFYLDTTTAFPMDELPLFRAVEGESTDNVEMYVRNPNVPEGAYVSVSGRPLRDQNGKQQGGVIVFHDMTERFQTADRLNQAFAQGRLEVVDTILHNIGNAINSVAVGVDTVHAQLDDDALSSRLTALANALEAHQEDLGEYVTNHPQGRRVLPFISALAADLREVDADLKQTVRRIRDKTTHIVDIVRTQKSYDNLSDNRKDINLAEAFSSAVNVLNDSIEKRNIQVEIDCDNAIGEIRIQESQFHQMIVNLVKNSIEAIDELEEPNDVSFIRIRARSDADSLHIDVADNGIGIDAGQDKTIFSAGYTTKLKGTGLGLHSSANFVIATGGKISASSEGYGKGMTIHIELPCSRILPNHHSTQRTEDNGQS